MSYDNARRAACVVHDAGGRIVGRTRLQKIAYLLSAVGLGEDAPFVFAYKHYGPYSEDLAAAAHNADLLGLITETEHQAAWGGTYSVYEYHGGVQPDRQVPPARRSLAEQAAAADAVELELAATAVFLAKEKNPAPWDETARRKPEKAKNGRLEGARELYRELAAIQTPDPWPDIL